MNLSKDILPVSYVKSHTAEMLKRIEENKTPVVITQNGEAKAVLIDVNSYQSLMDSINLLKLISIGENDIKKGKIVSHNDVKERIEKIVE